MKLQLSTGRPSGEGGRLHARRAAPHLLHVQARQHGRLEARGTLDPVPCKTGSFGASHTLCLPSSEFSLLHHCCRAAPPPRACDHATHRPALPAAQPHKPWRRAFTVVAALQSPAGMALGNCNERMVGAIQRMGGWAGEQRAALGQNEMGYWWHQGAAPWAGGPIGPARAAPLACVSSQTQRTPHSCLQLGHKHEVDDVHDRVKGITRGHVGLQARRKGRRRVTGELAREIKCSAGAAVSCSFLLPLSLPHLDDLGRGHSRVGRDQAHAVGADGHSDVLAQQGGQHLAVSQVGGESGDAGNDVVAAGRKGSKRNGEGGSSTWLRLHTHAHACRLSELLPTRGAALQAWLPRRTTTNNHAAVEVQRHRTMLAADHQLALRTMSARPAAAKGSSCTHARMLVSSSVLATTSSSVTFSAPRASSKASLVGANTVRGT